MYILYIIQDGGQSNLIIFIDRFISTVIKILNQGAAKLDRFSSPVFIFIIYGWDLRCELLNFKSSLTVLVLCIRLYIERNSRLSVKFWLRQLFAEIYNPGHSIQLWGPNFRPIPRIIWPFKVEGWSNIPR